jgi:hypothetical protein
MIMTVQYMVEKHNKVAYYIQLENFSDDTLYILSSPYIDGYMSTMTKYGWRRIISIDWGWSGIIKYDMESGDIMSVIPFYPKETMNRIIIEDYPSNKIGELWLGFNYLNTKPTVHDVVKVNGKEVYAVFYGDYTPRYKNEVYGFIKLTSPLKPLFDKETPFGYHFSGTMGNRVIPLKMKELTPIK